MSELTIRAGEDGPIIASRTVALPAAGVIDIAVAPSRFTTGSGRVALVADLAPLAGEADARNNRAVAVAEVVDEPIRVALFDARPSWDTKFFVSACRADPRVDVTTVMAIGDRERLARHAPTAGAQAPSEAPVSADALGAFDVVVLGRGVDRWFPGDGASSLERYVVDRGGSLVLLRADPIAGDARASEVIRSLAPVSLTGATLPGGRLAPEPGRVPAIDEADRAGLLAAMPPVVSVASGDAETPGAVVWLRVDEGGGFTPRADRQDPVAVAHGPAGRGRVLAVLTDGLWRWAFLPGPRGERHGVYRAFWSGALRWLALGGDFAPGRGVALSVEPPSARPGEPVRIVVSRRTEPDASWRPLLTVRAPDGSRARLLARRLDETAARWTAMFTPAAEGLHEARLAPQGEQGALAAPFPVREDRAEFLRTAARPDALRALAERTGGMTLGLDALDRMIEHMTGVRGALVEASARREHAWDVWALFGAIAALLACEWFLRRSGGMA